MMEEIRRRLIRYLERDRKGIRREVLSILVDGKKYTTTEIYEKLRQKGYDINLRGVSAMIGLMNTKLGIVKMEIGERNRYYIKSEYIDLVKSVLKGSQS
jgi:arginine repressor